jgi:ribosomal protein S12 methylthiotransferase
MKRGLDAERMKKYFIANGCILVDRSKDANLIIALTCSFVSSYVETAVEMIRILKKDKGHLIVAGCLPGMAKSKLDTVFSGDYILTKDFEKLDLFFPRFKVSYTEIPDAIIPDLQVMKPFSNNETSPIAVRNSISDKTNRPAILRISEGCNNFCTYCSHPLSLGPLKSKPLQNCIQDYQRIIAEGYKRISIHANDPGAYGLDIGSSLPQLFSILNKKTTKEQVKWNILDINPRWLVKYKNMFFDVLKWKRVALIGVPIQSGSPIILKKMKRYNNVTEVIKILKEFKKIDTNIRIATHLITGFPGETREDMEMSIDLFRKVKIDIAYLFKFSSNLNTKAARFRDKLISTKVDQIHSEMFERISEMDVKVELFS